MLEELENHLQDLKKYEARTERLLRNGEVKGSRNIRAFRNGLRQIWDEIQELETLIIAIKTFK